MPERNRASNIHQDRYAREVAQYYALFDRFPLERHFVDGDCEIRLHRVGQKPEENRGK